MLALARASTPAATDSALAAPSDNSAAVCAGSSCSAWNRSWTGRSTSTTASAVSDLSGPYWVYSSARSWGGRPVAAPRIDSRLRHARLGDGVEAHLAVGVGDGPLELLGHGGQVVEQVARCPASVVGGLGHLVGRLLQVHDPGADRGDGGLGHDERVAVAAVEALGDVAGELEVLALVVAHRHLVGVVQEDVGRLQRRVGEQPGGDEVLPLGLVLELRHAPQLPEAGDALQDPGQLGVLGHVALDEQGADAPGRARRPAAPGPARGCLARSSPGVLGHGEGVEVDDAEEAVGPVLVVDPVAHRPEQVAEVEVAGGLDAGEDAGHGRRSYRPDGVRPAPRFPK